jgi:hypothetical protein
MLRPLPAPLPPTHIHTQVDVGAMSEGLWPTFLGTYPAQELAWLEAAAEQEVRGEGGPLGWRQQQSRR